MEDKPEYKESLWWLIVSPTIWAVHFLASYISVALWCGKVVGRDGSLDTARLLIGTYTALALLFVALTGRHGYRRHNTGKQNASRYSDTPEDRHRFLGLATLLLSLLSGVAIAYVALPILYIETCR
jgi:hypothetical protein